MVDFCWSKDLFTLDLDAVKMLFYWWIIVISPEKYAKPSIDG